MIEACETEVVTMTGCKHSLVREEGERVGLNELADFLDRVLVAYKFLWRMYIHAIVASVLERRAGNTHMHFCGTGLAKHLDDLERCGSAYDGVIHDHHPLALDDGSYRRELHLHTLLTKRLGRKDECTSHILALDESHFVWKSAGLCITLSRTEAGIRNSDHDVGISRSLLEKDSAGFFSVIMHIAESESEYLEKSKIRSMLEKYCSFMPTEIYLIKENSNETQVIKADEKLVSLAEKYAHLETIEGDYITDTEEDKALTLATKYAEIDKQIKELTVIKDGYQLQLKAMIAEHEGIKDRNGNLVATYKANKTTKFDSKALLSKYPSIYEEYNTIVKHELDVKRLEAEKPDIYKELSYKERRFSNKVKL